MVSAPWTLTRHEDELRIDLLDMEPLSQVENQAIVDALKEQLAEDGVSTVRLDGPAVNTQPVPKGFGRLTTTLATLAEAEGVRFHVGPL